MPIWFPLCVVRRIVWGPRVKNFCEKSTLCHICVHLHVQWIIQFYCCGPKRPSQKTDRSKKRLPLLLRVLKKVNSIALSSSSLTTGNNFCLRLCHIAGISMFSVYVLCSVRRALKVPMWEADGIANVFSKVCTVYFYCIQSANVWAHNTYLCEMRKKVISIENKSSDIKR